MQHDGRGVIPENYFSTTFSVNHKQKQLSVKQKLRKYIWGRIKKLSVNKLNDKRAYDKTKGKIFLSVRTRQSLTIKTMEMATPITRIQSLINTCYWLCKTLQSLPHSDLQGMQVHVRGVSGAGYINPSCTYAIHTQPMEPSNY